MMKSQSHKLTNLAKVVIPILLVIFMVTPYIVGSVNNATSSYVLKLDSETIKYIGEDAKLYDEISDAKISSRTNQTNKPKAERPKPTERLVVQRKAKLISRSHDWYSKKQFKCLVELWDRESNWNYKAKNSSSGAYGIAQALPPSKMDVVGTDWIKNPDTQIVWGLKYINERYGNPCKALKHHDLKGWY